MVASVCPCMSSLRRGPQMRYTVSDSGAPGAMAISPRASVSGLARRPVSGQEQRAQSGPDWDTQDTEPERRPASGTRTRERRDPSSVASRPAPPRPAPPRAAPCEWALETGERERRSRRHKLF